MHVQVLDTAARDRLHRMALEILQQIGLAVAGREPRERLLESGGVVRGDRICLSPEMVAAALVKVPSEGFEMAGRDGRCRIRIAPGQVHFRPAGGLPFVLDSETRRRRPATVDDARILARLVDALPEIDVVNCAASPADLGVGIRNVRRFAIAVRASRKPTDITASGPDEVDAVAEICAVLRNGSAAAAALPLAYVYVSPTSPLRLSEQEALATLACARHDVPLAMLPCPTLAATAPVTLAGALAQEWAEQLAQLVLAYTVRPGLPVIACNRISPADLRRGSAVMCGPELGLAAAAFTELATSFGLPVNSWGFATGSHLPDQQAGAERAMGTLLAALAGATVISGTGTLSNALLVSVQQMLIDAEIIRMVRHTLGGVPVSDDTLATAYFEDGVEAGTFMASEHTLQQLRGGTLWLPELFDSVPYETWGETGRDIFQRARDAVAMILARPEPAALPAAADAEIERILSAAGA